MGTALALEALHAARAIAAEPEIVRGGPWAKPTLTDEMLAEARTVADVRSLLKLEEIAQADPSGRLYRHLRDLEFAPAADAPPGAPTCRGAYIRKIRRNPGTSSGTAGNKSRKSQLRAGTLERGTSRWHRLKRGVDKKARRKAEQTNRKTRPYCLRRPAASSS
jgi:hypothetical protein